MGFALTDGAVRFCTTCRAVYHSDFARCPNDGGTLEITDDDPLVGSTVAHYTVDAYIGGGAMGRVYRCHHTHLHHKIVALKVLRGDLAAMMAMRLRFTQEAEAASRLVHPNVVSVMDFGRTELGLLYLAMEFVEGASLAELIDQGPISARRTVRIVRELCLGLGHAHELGFVHRDLKPDNIIVVKDGDKERPRIVDFGLAIHADPNADSARLTSVGAAVGTPIYAAPEQMSNLDDVDYRADLFALGVTMFEMLAGKIPFDGGMLETMHLNATSDRPTIAARAPGVVVPLRLERLVQRLMSASRSDRPASTDEVLDELALIDLELTHSGVAVLTPPAGVAAISQTDRVERAPNLRPSRAWLYAVLVVMLAGAGGATWYATRPTTDPATPVAPPSLALAPVAPEVHAALIDAAPPPPPVVAITPPPRVAKPAHTGHGHHPKLAIETHAVIDPPVVPEPVSEPPPVDPPKQDPPKQDPPKPKPLEVIAKPARVMTTAKLTLDELSVRGALTQAQIQRALDRVMPALRSCYGPAAVKANKSPSVAVRIRFEIDETQQARAIQATDAVLPGLSSCLKQGLANVRAEAAPDVGTVDITFVIKLVPEDA